MRILTLPAWQTLALDIGAWVVIHGLTGYAVHRLSDRHLDHDNRLLRPRPFEDGGRWYRRTVRIHRWKDVLPEAGAFFAGGVSKKKLASTDDAGLAAFARETRRAELGHWAAIPCAGLFVLWNPPLAVVIMVVYAFAFNLPFIMIQRYNRQRLQRLRDRRVLTNGAT